MSETLRLLGGLSIFSRLDDEALRAVESRTVTRRLSDSEMLFRQGEACGGLHVVVQGAVRVYRANRSGREQVLHVQGPGQPLAEVPLFDGGPYPASARAEGETRVLFLPTSSFEHLYRTHPAIADAVIRELGRRLRRMVRLVEKLSLRDVPARVAMTLLEYAEREGTPADGMVFRIPRTQEQLAAELGTTRESVARALSRLRAEGTIGREGSRVRILRLADLEHRAFHAGADR